jgi:hypothetical protein
LVTAKAEATVPQVGTGRLFNMPAANRSNAHAL